MTSAPTPPRAPTSCLDLTVPAGARWIAATSDGPVRAVLQGSGRRLLVYVPRESVVAILGVPEREGLPQEAVARWYDANPLARPAVYEVAADGTSHRSPREEAPDFLWAVPGASQAARVLRRARPPAVEASLAAPPSAPDPGPLAPEEAAPMVREPAPTATGELEPPPPPEEAIARPTHHPEPLRAPRWHTPDEGTVHLGNWSRQGIRGVLWATELLDALSDGGSDPVLERTGAAFAQKLLRKGWHLSVTNRAAIQEALRVYDARTRHTRIFVLEGRTYFARDTGDRIRLVGPGGSTAPAKVAALVARAYGRGAADCFGPEGGSRTTPGHPVARAPAGPSRTV